MHFLLVDNWEIFSPLIQGLVYVLHWGEYEKGRAIEKRPITLFNAASIVVKQNLLPVVEFPNEERPRSTQGRYSLACMDAHRAAFYKMIGRDDQVLFARFISATRFMRIGPSPRSLKLPETPEE